MTPIIKIFQMKAYRLVYNRMEEIFYIEQMLLQKKTANFCFGQNRITGKIPTDSEIEDTKFQTSDDQYSHKSFDTDQAPA